MGDVIIPVYLKVSPETAVRLAAGTATRFGSVVRDGSRIVEHLKEVPAPTRGAGQAVTKAVRALSSRKALLLVAVVVLVLAGLVVAGVWVVKRVRLRRATRAEMEFSQAAGTYLAAIGNREIGPEVVERLRSSLDALQDRLGAAGLPLDAPAAPTLAELAQVTDDYWRQLAAANNVTVLPRAEADAGGGSTRQALEDVRGTLVAQKGLWEAA